MSDLPNIRVPDAVDAWRMVAAQREFEGRIPLAAMTRLRDSLLEPEGDVTFVYLHGSFLFDAPFGTSTSRCTSYPAAASG